MSDDLLRQRLRLRQMQMRAQQTQAPDPAQQQAAAPQEAPQPQEAPPIGQAPPYAAQDWQPVDLSAYPEAEPGMMGDVLRAGGAGLARGAAGLADVPGAIMGAGASLGAAAARGLGFGSPESEQSAQQVMQMAAPMQSGQLRERVAEDTGGYSEFRGETTPGRYAGTVGEFLPGAAAFGGGGLANVLRYGVAPGLASEAAGQATEGTEIEPYARLVAALLAGPVVNAAEGGIRRLISPHGGADAGRLSLAQVLDDFDVPVSAGQRVGNEALRRREGMTAAGQRLNEAQREAMTSAALRTAGTDARRATPEVLEQTARRIGAVFDDVARGVDVVPDPNAVNALAAANQTYSSLAPSASRAPIIGEVFRRVSSAYRSGNTIPASTLNTWRSRLSSMTTSSDSATRQAAIEAMRALDDSLSATLTASGRSADVARLAEARGQWRNFLAIQRAATGAGEGAAAGVLTPSALRNAVVQQGRASYAQGGRGDLGELARAAEGVIRPLPTSGTAENMRALGVPAWGLSGGGAAAGYGLGGAMGGMAGAAIGAAAPQIAGAARMSGFGQAYLGNQLVAPGPRVFQSGSLSPLAAALMGFEQE